VDFLGYPEIRLDRYFQYASQSVPIDPANPAAVIVVGGVKLGCRGVARENTTGEDEGGLAAGGQSSGHLALDGIHDRGCANS